MSVSLNIAVSSNMFAFRHIFICTADACMVAFNGDLFLIGGSKSWYRYANEPSKAWVLLKPPPGGTRRHWRDDIVPPLLGSRMWHSCIVASIGQSVINSFNN